MPYGHRVIFVVLPSSLVDSMVWSSKTVTWTFRSGASTKLIAPSVYVQLPNGPSLVPSGRKSIANSQSPSVPHFPYRNSLVGCSPLVGMPLLVDAADEVGADVILDAASLVAELVVADEDGAFDAVAAGLVS